MQEKNAVYHKPFRLFIIELVSKNIESSILHSLLCKIIRTAITLSYGIRRDTHICLSINSLKTSLLCQGNLIKGLYVDEPSCVGFLKKLFAKNIGIGFKFIDDCLHYAYSLGLQELELEPLLYNSIDVLKRSIEACESGIYIRIALDEYGNTTVGLKIWNLLTIVNIILDNIYHDSRL